MTNIAVSNPTRSVNRNVPDLGLPSVGPDNLSTSDMLKPNYNIPVMQGAVANNNNIKCYFNRFPIYNASQPTAFGISPTLSLFISPARPLGIEAVRIYNRALSSEEIGKLIDWYKQKGRENFPRIIEAP